jgi:hypothetical protein
VISKLGSRVCLWATTCAPHGDRPSTTIDVGAPAATGINVGDLCMCIREGLLKSFATLMKMRTT